MAVVAALQLWPTSLDDRSMAVRRRHHVIIVRLAWSYLPATSVGSENRRKRQMSELKDAGQASMTLTAITSPWAAPHAPRSASPRLCCSGHVIYLSKTTRLTKGEIKKSKKMSKCMTVALPRPIPHEPLKHLGSSPAPARARRSSEAKREKQMETNGKSMVISGMLQQRGIPPPQKKQSSHINIGKTNMIACLSL
jgi:hypothetical protein